MKAKPMDLVILSTTMLIDEGNYVMEELHLGVAREWVRRNHPVNFSAHQTVKLLDIEPATSREQCKTYDQALVLKPASRLEFGKEYSLEEIEQIGVTAYLISRTDNDKYLDL